MILCGFVLLVSGSVLVYATYNPALDTAWEDWKSTHQKGYFGLGEEDIRRTIWEKNMQLIEAHNQEYELGIHTYKLGMNHLGDMTTEEVVATMTGFRPDMEEEINETFVPDSKAAPSSIDYRAKGYVTPVKNQGSCGSCWAFSVVGALEGQLRKQGKELVDLSPQNLVDCVGQDSGCNGGWMTYPFDYIRRNGLATEKAYPYTGRDERCHYKSSMNRASWRGYGKIKKGYENRLKLALSQIGPISVCIDASLETFHFYKKGIYNDWRCSRDDLGHAVLAVGYTTRYWIVKNSWGTDWGDKGYIYIEKGRNRCGIANEAIYPVM